MLGRFENKKNIWLLIVVGAIVVLLIFLTKNQPDVKKFEENKYQYVHIKDVQIGDNKSWIYSQGVLKPKTQIRLSSQVSGRVHKISPKFDSGGHFKANENILEIEDVDYLYALSKAEANLANASENLSIERSRSKQAKQEWIDLGDKSSNDLFLRKPQLESAKANFKAAQSQLSLAKLNLSRTKVNLPYDALILEKFVDLGQFVSIGLPLADIYDSSRALITLPIKASDRLMLDLTNQSINVFLYAIYGDKQYEWIGKLLRADSKLDDVTKQYKLVVEVNDPFLLKNNNFILKSAGSKPPLAIGQFLKAKIPGDVIADSLIIPKKALRINNKIWILYEDKLKYLSVDVIGSEDDMLLVKLRENSLNLKVLSLVVSDLSVSYPGMLIKQFPIEAEQY